MKLVDMKCNLCSKVYEDVFYDGIEELKCSCGGKLLRIFSCRKYPEYPEGFYENFDHEPLYIRDRSHFYKEAKKRGLEPVIPRKEYRKARKRKYFT